MATVIAEVSHLSALGTEFNEPMRNIDKLHVHKEKVIRKRTGGLAAMVKMRKATIMRSLGQQ